ncbi:MAG: hypothetical protein K2M67_01235 [Muribaculaceae bacterium]|nr:hypothetical protein [Muribaculaceae bacterium]
MSIRLIVTAVFIIAGLLPSMALEYGLRFRSHSVAESERTALRLSDTPFPFSSELSMSFEMDFYDLDQFGHICTIEGDNGTTISFVSSSENGTFYPCIAINDKLNIIPVAFSALGGKPVRPVITLQKKENRVVVVFNGQRFIYPANLSKMNSATIEFGWKKTLPTVAPIEVQDIDIYLDKRNTHKWELRKHKGDIVEDDLSGAIASAISPHWIVDDHVTWRSIFEMKSKELIQTAFNPKSETFYIAGPGKITVYHAKDNSMEAIPVSNDGRVMKYSNYLVFDNLSNQLLSYTIGKKQTSRFNFDTRQWSVLPNPDEEDKEPEHANHAVAGDGKNLYMFGGYGFYMYHNNLLRLNLETDQMDDIVLSPVPQPRTQSAMCVVGDKLYLFGGMGNQVGKQEIPTENYYDLWEYNLRNFKGRKVWEMDTVSRLFLPSASMYYVAKDSCFYFASTLHGGCMMRIPINKPMYEVVSEPIHSKMDYRDCVFDLYRSEDEKNYYLVLDKRIDKTSHDYHIYRISYPFSNILMYDADATTDSGMPLWGWICLVGGIAGAATFGAVYGNRIYKRRRKVSGIPAEVDNIDHTSSKSSPETAYESAPAPIPAPTPASAPDSTITSAKDAISTYTDSDIPALGSSETSEKTVTESAGGNEESAVEVNEGEDQTPALPEVKPSAATSAPIPEAVRKNRKVFNPRQEAPKKPLIFTQDKSTISLLGKFKVTDKQGYDITPRFTSRIQMLLIMLLIASAKDEKGINFEVLDEEIWGDRDEKSAKNNRNVYMRRLRVLLEEVGNLEISYDRGYYRIDSSDVFIDYKEVISRLERLSNVKNEDEITQETVDETLELLLRGTLLPNISYDWLDKYKASYTEASLSMLSKELAKLYSAEEDTEAYRIAETISLHDPFSEEALAVKIKILCKRRMKGPARTIYDSFCKEYERCLGEQYQVSFNDIVQAE